MSEGAYELGVEGSTGARAGVVSVLEELSVVCACGKPTLIKTIWRDPQVTVWFFCPFVSLHGLVHLYRICFFSVFTP